MDRFIFALGGVAVGAALAIGAAIAIDQPDPARTQLAELQQRYEQLQREKSDYASRLDELIALRPAMEEVRNDYQSLAVENQHLKSAAAAASEARKQLGVSLPELNEKFGAAKDWNVVSIRGLAGEREGVTYMAIHGATGLQMIAAGRPSDLKSLMVLCPLHLDRTAKANEIRVTAASMILATCGPWSEVELRDAIAENAEVLEPQVDPVVIRRGDVELHLGAIETREGALLAVSLQAADPPAAGD